MSNKPSVVLTGALIKFYLNGKLYKEIQSVGYSIEYGETEIYGIDSPFPQEIATTRVSVSGQVSGLRIKLSGGIMAYNGRTLIKDIVSSPYVSIRIQDRQTAEDLLFIPNAKIVNQRYEAAAKGTVKMSFSFKGLVPLEPLDRA